MCRRGITGIDLIHSVRQNNTFWSVRAQLLALWELYVLTLLKPLAIMSYMSPRQPLMSSPPLALASLDAYLRLCKAAYYF